MHHDAGLTMTQDRPDKAELLDALIEYLMEQLFPTLDGELAFHARVSANLLTILKRELELGEQMDADELVRLKALLNREDGSLYDLTRDLAQQIRAGDLDSEHDEVLSEVKRTVEDKLKVVSPKYLKS
jgi:AcrR family transcriptional regulator